MGIFQLGLDAGGLRAGFSCLIRSNSDRTDDSVRPHPCLSYNNEEKMSSRGRVNASHDVPIGGVRQ